MAAPDPVLAGILRELAATAATASGRLLAVGLHMDDHTHLLDALARASKWPRSIQVDTYRRLRYRGVLVVRVPPSRGRRGTVIRITDRGAADALLHQTPPAPAAPAKLVTTGTPAPEPVHYLRRLWQTRTRRVE